MKKNHVLFIILFTCFYVHSQKNYFFTTNIETGISNIKYNSITTIDNSLITKTNNNYNARIELGVLLELKKNWNTSINFAQNLRFWNLTGQTNNTELIVQQKQYFPSITIGIFKELPIYKKKYSLYSGLNIALDFLDFEGLNHKDGNTTDYIEAYTSNSHKIISNVIYEIGLKKNLKNGNRCFFSLKYYQPINGKLVKGTVTHIVNNFPKEQVHYESSGVLFAIAIKYAFKLKRN